jgi:hypothetical protein
LNHKIVNVVKATSAEDVVHLAFQNPALGVPCEVCTVIDTGEGRYCAVFITFHLVSYA